MSIVLFTKALGAYCVMFSKKEWIQREEIYIYITYITRTNRLVVSSKALGSMTHAFATAVCLTHGVSQVYGPKNDPQRESSTSPNWEDAIHNHI